MHSHLVTVKVCIKCSTYKRMKLYSLALYKYWLKRLNTKSVKCRGTVQHNRMLLNYLFKHIPNLRLKLFNHLLRCLYIVRLSLRSKLLHNKWLKQLDCHFLRKTTLIYLKLRAYNNNRTSGIVNTLTEKILTETSLLTLQHI